MAGLIQNRWLIGSVLIIAGLAIVGSLLPERPSAGSDTGSAQTFNPDPRGVAVAKLLAVDDFSAYLVGKRNVGDWTGVQPLAERVTGLELYGAYNTNEVSADNRFKGNAIVLTGTIRKISKDVLNNIYVVVDGGG